MLGDTYQAVAGISLESFPLGMVAENFEIFIFNNQVDTNLVVSTEIFIYHNANNL